MSERLLTFLSGALLVLVLFIFSGASICRAADWDNTDRVLFGTFIGLQVVDGLQTHNITKHPDQFRETNPLLGSHPSDAKIVVVKSAAVGLAYLATADASPTTRKVVLGALDVFYINVTAHNASIGVKVGF